MGNSSFVSHLQRKKICLFPCLPVNEVGPCALNACNEKSSWRKGGIIFRLLFVVVVMVVVVMGVETGY